MAEYKQPVSTEAGDRGVIQPGHPPVIVTVLIAAGKNYRAGTLLKDAADGAVASAAETTGGSVTPAEQATAVLTEDVDTTGGARPALCLRHGMVVRARLLNGNGSGDPVAASDAMANTLPVRGIYPVQGFDYSVMA
jgi:hypothetical protein